MTQSCCPLTGLSVAGTGRVRTITGFCTGRRKSVEDLLWSYGKLTNSMWKLAHPDDAVDGYWNHSVCKIMEQSVAELVSSALGSPRAVSPVVTRLLADTRIT